MLPRARLRRTRARLDQGLHPRPPRPPAPPPPPPPAPQDPAAPVGATAAAAGPAADGVGAGPGGSDVPARAAPPVPPAEAPREPHHRQGLCWAQSQQWNRAQRALELAVRADPAGPASADLASVRAVRRQLRLLQKWPRDAQALVALGQANMELELGAAAEQAYRQAIAVAPAEPAGDVGPGLGDGHRGGGGGGGGAHPPG